MARTKVPRVRDPIRFRSSEAEAQYSHYAHKKVEGGRMVNLAELALFNVERAFGDMGWLPVITYDACTCPDLVRGVNISFDYLQLADLLGIPYDGPMVYCTPGEPQFVSTEMRAEIDSQLLRPDRWQMRACYMRPAPRVFCKIIHHNLIPHSGHYERVSQLTQYLLYNICTRQPVCLPYIIMRTMISATLPSHRGNLPYGRMITILLTPLGVDLVDEKVQDKTFSSPLDWEVICKMGMRDAQVSDEERNETVHPHTRIEIADAEAATAVARVHADPTDDDGRMYMDVDSIPTPSPTHVARAGTSSTAGPAPETGPSHVAGPSRPASDMMVMLHEIREAQCRSDLRMEELLDAQIRTDQRVADLTASLQATQTQVAWLTRVYVEDYDKDCEAPPPP
ncbi:hypothetical protein NE237_019390 [Protea cynaroides]|uniref:Uncharacterized protein n=1 Tax=Protea cynaroides TaxID=273540 RepID=A0A9Q0KBP9_9MAGN|nr:hypothetical protein NE237_019390 [Protea cynaroides]